MSMTFVQQIQAEIEQLETELARDPKALKLLHLRELLALYGNVAEPTQAAPDKPQASRRMSPARSAALDVAASFLHGRAEPTPTRAILDHNPGLDDLVGGKDKVANLSAMLSNAKDRFVSHGRAGWTLTSEFAPGTMIDKAPHEIGAIYETSQDDLVLDEETRKLIY